MYASLRIGSNFTYLKKKLMYIIRIITNSIYCEFNSPSLKIK